MTAVTGGCALPVGAFGTGFEAGLAAVADEEVGVVGAAGAPRP